MPEQILQAIEHIRVLRRRFARRKLDSHEITYRTGRDTTIRRRRATL